MTLEEKLVFLMRDIDKLRNELLKGDSHLNKNILEIEYNLKKLLNINNMKYLRYYLCLECEGKGKICKYFSSISDCGQDPYIRCDECKGDGFIYK